MVLSNLELGDVVFSVTASVNKPIPMLPESLLKHQSAMVNLETRTLHLITAPNIELLQDITLWSCNFPLENALLEISKWELNEHDLKRRLLTESLHYAALSSGVSKLHINDFLEVCSTGSTETIVFSVEGSDDKHFTLPSQVNVPTTSAGNLWGYFLLLSKLFTIVQVIYRLFLIVAPLLT